MYCKRCNKKYNNETKFCTTCGEPLVEKKADTKVVLGIIIAVLLAAIVGLGIFTWNVLHSDKENVKIEEDDFSNDSKKPVTDDKDVADEDTGDEAAGEDETTVEDSVEEETEANLEASFADYLADENLITSEEYEITINRQNEEYYGDVDFSVIPEGIAGSQVYDFDKDGDDELLVLKHTGNGILQLFMYENENGSITQSAKFNLSDAYIELYAYTEGKIALYYTDDEIFVEDSNHTWLFADGISLNVLALKYNGKEFITTFRTGCSGSDLDADNNDLMKDLSDYGVPKSAWNKLASRRNFIYEYIDGANGICQIKAKHIIGIEEAMAWSDNTKLTSMKVTKIKIKDLEIDDEVIDEDNAYILNDSDSRYIDISELEGFDKEKCRLARNEIFARRGRIFDDEELKNYFSSKDWYMGYLGAEYFDESFLNDYELKNLDTIISYEKSKGYR